MLCKDRKVEETLSCQLMMSRQTDKLVWSVIITMVTDEPRDEVISEGRLTSEEETGHCRRDCNSDQSLMCSQPAGT